MGAISLSLLFAAGYSSLLPSAQSSTFVFIITILLICTFLMLSLKGILIVAALCTLYLGFALFLIEQSNRAILQPDNVISIILISAVAITVAQFSYSSRRQRFAYEIVIRRYNEFLKDLAALDGLTGVPNRRTVDEVIASIQAIASRQPVAFQY